jgi:hypothetical protein
MTAALSTIGVDEDPTLDDLVAAAVQDADFVAASGPLDREARAVVAEKAICAALVHMALVAMVQEIEHKRSGHA